MYKQTILSETKLDAPDNQIFLFMVFRCAHRELHYLMFREQTKTPDRRLEDSKCIFLQW